MNAVARMPSRQEPVRFGVVEWLSPEQVCERVPGMTVVNLQELRKSGRGPAYSKPTRKTVIYSAADVDEWVRRARVSTREQS